MSLVQAFGNTEIIVSHYKCFGAAGGVLGRLKPITVIIGRNNSGKSAIVDALKHMSTKGGSFDGARHSRGSTSPEFRFTAELSEPVLRRVFHENTSGGEIPGNHWRFAQQFMGREVVIRYPIALSRGELEGFSIPEMRPEASKAYQDQLAGAVPMPLGDFKILAVAAERDVGPEGATNGAPTLHPNGQGLTNMVRAFINRDSLPREQVEIDLLRELNAVYRGDSEFTRISCRENDSGNWEIFLEELGKGSIRLSQSGSSLKSVFITLCQLRLAPLITQVDWQQTLFVVEEPENNLHPSLLRRLLEFLADARSRLGFMLVITTHSPIAIDWISRREDGKILHVTHDGHEAVIKEAASYLQYRDVLDDLDIRASDILQANGIVWVEGPSDRIYVRRWLELISNGQLKEGVHYSVLFYGGKLLSHLTTLSPAQQEDLVNTLSINRNAAVMMDSDRHLGTAATDAAPERKPRMNLNQTKTRILEEIRTVGGFGWVTDGREVENYISSRVLALLSGEPNFSIGLYERVPEHPSLITFKGDKISLANAACAQFTKDDLLSNPELLGQLEKLHTHIKKWNALS